MIEQANDPKLILTPQINEWMLKHYDRFTKEAIMRVAEAYSSPPRDRTRSFSASAAGTCLRKQELTFLGKPQKKPLPAAQEIFSIGTALHQMWQTRLLSAGLIEDIEVPLFWPAMLSKGSADGRGFVSWETTDPKYMNREFILELKTMGSFQWDATMDKGAPKDEHMAQIHRYMLVSGIDLAIYILVDKGNHSKLGWHEMVIEADPVWMQKSKEELDELVKAAKTETLHDIKPHCKLKMGSEYKYCPFSGSKGPCLNTTDWG